MIVSNLQNSQRVEGLHPLFKTLFDYVKTHDLFHAELGRIEIDGDNLFINNVNPECVARDKQVLELHRDYIDVHILLEGTETIGWKAIEDLKDEAKDWNTLYRIKKFDNCMTEKCLENAAVILKQVLEENKFPLYKSENDKLYKKQDGTYRRIKDIYAELAGGE